MLCRFSAVVLALVIASSEKTCAFVPAVQLSGRTVSTLQLSTISEADNELKKAIRAKVNYKAGAADTDFARKFGHLAGAKVKTVGETFAEFTKMLGYSINPLYKGMITDLVGTLHLVVVNARFQRDPIWCLGIVKALELLLKNYPEANVRGEIESALFTAVGLSESEVRADAVKAQEWIAGMSRQEVESALSGEGDSPLAALAKNIQSEKFWMYSRYFGIGLLQVMETVGMTMDKDEVYPIMEDWMSKKLGKSHLTACSDSDLFFRVREKLDMMETLMKEIEIREKKRMAERLEEKAEQALRAADREAQMQQEIEAEAARNRERVKA